MVRASMDWPRESQHIQAQSVSKDTLFSCLPELQFVPQQVQSALHSSAHQLTRWKAAQDVAKSEMPLSSPTNAMDKPHKQPRWRPGLGQSDPIFISHHASWEIVRVNTQTTAEDDECRTRASTTNWPKHAPLHSDGRHQQCNERSRRI